MSFPPATEMFQFAGFASPDLWIQPGYPCGWVAPFGDPRINDRSHLPRAYRSVPRPSSPLSAKASTRCPYLRLIATPNGKDQSRATVASHAATCRALSATLTRRHSFWPVMKPLHRRRHFAPRQLVAHEPSRRSPATVTQLASLRLSISSIAAATGCCDRSPGSSPRHGSSDRLLAQALSTRRTPIAPQQRADGGGDRDRTDDPLLAKQVLSQLSYTPGSRSRHRPDRRSQTPRAVDAPDRPRGSAQTAVAATAASEARWWAREDLNLRPHAYQARALTS